MTFSMGAGNFVCLGALLLAACGGPTDRAREPGREGGGRDPGAPLPSTGSRPDASVDRAAPAADVGAPADAAGEAPRGAGGDAASAGRAAPDAGSPGRPADAAAGAQDGAPLAPGPSGPGRVGLGAWSACAVGADWTARCWGLPHVTANGGNRNQAPEGLKAVALSGHHHGACGILKEPAAPDDAIRCWGADLGRVKPPAVRDPVELTSGDFHTCARARDGAVTCWKGSGEAAAAPADVLATPPGLKAKAICSVTYNCAIGADDAVVCWGGGAPKPPEGLKAKAIACGGWFEYGRGARHACAIGLDDAVVCWGDPAGGATMVPPGLKATAIAAGNQSSCAVGKDDGLVTCWGTLGADRGGVSTGFVRTPEKLAARAVFMNHETAAAIGADGRLVVWGVLRAATPAITVP
jgi:hypothetical protein